MFLNYVERYEEMIIHRSAIPSVIVSQNNFVRVFLCFVLLKVHP